MSNREGTPPSSSPLGTDAMDDYLEEIGRYPLLTAAEEAALFRTLREVTDPEDKEAGAKAGAKNTLIQSNLRLVVKVAKKYQGKGLGLPDLISEGNFGLIRAIELFKPELEFRLSTYATWCITTFIERALTSHATPVRIPEYLAIARRKWNKAQGRLTVLLKREPTFEEVADHLGLSESLRDRMVLAMVATRPRCEEVELERVIADEVLEEEGSVEDLRLLADRLGLLQERERDIVSLRYGLGGRKPLSGPGVGRIHGLSRERVRQIVRDSIELMRRSG